MTQFTDFAISEALKKRIASLNFITPTPVQGGAIPPALEGKDVLATAQTGTGKTLSFLIPILEKLAASESRSATALILLPTRELAMQVEVAFRSLNTNPGHTVALVVGGMAEGPQLQTIRRGARLIVATPGRLEDYLNRKLVKLDAVQILVLDEVDRMLDMGFKPAIRRIGRLPAPVASDPLLFGDPSTPTSAKLSASILKTRFASKSARYSSPLKTLSYKHSKSSRIRSMSYSSTYSSPAKAASWSSFAPSMVPTALPAA